MQHKFNLGKKLCDSITGFTGEVMGVANYHDGTVQYALLSHVLKDGKPMDWVWIDEKRLYPVGGRSLRAEFIPEGDKPRPR